MPRPSCYCVRPIGYAVPAAPHQYAPRPARRGTVPAPSPDRSMGRCPSRCCGFGFLGELGKGRRFACGEFDARVLQSEHELAVRQSVLAGGGVDADDPEAAIVALLPLAPDIRIDAR